MNLDQSSKPKASTSITGLLLNISRSSSDENQYHLTIGINASMSNIRGDRVVILVTKDILKGLFNTSALSEIIKIPDLFKNGSLSEDQVQLLQANYVMVVVDIIGNLSIPNSKLNLPEATATKITLKSISIPEVHDAAYKIKTVVNDKPEPNHADWDDLEHSTNDFCPIPVPFDISEGVRIGYAIFDCPITHISQTRNTYIDQLPTLREPGSIKRGTGYAYENYTLSWIAHGASDINDSVKEVIEQITLNPFISVDGGPFGDLKKPKQGAIPYNEIAIKNFSISTIPGLPNSLSVQVNFDPFNWEYYAPPQLPNKDGKYHRLRMDDMICWPLYKIWCKSRGKSRYKGNNFTGSLTFKFPDSKTALAIDSLLRNPQYNSIEETDFKALTTLKNGLIEQDLESVTSRNAKELRGNNYSTGPVRTFALKVQDPETWKKFIADDFGYQGGPGEEDPAAVGLIDWTKLSATDFSDTQGNYIRSSTLVNPTYVTPLAGTGTQPIADIHIASQNYMGSTSIYGDIKTYLLKREGITTIPVSGDSGYPDYANRIVPLIKAAQDRPWNYFGIVLAVNGIGEQDKLSQKLDKMIIRMNGKIDYDYSSLADQISSKFTSDEGDVYTLNGGEEYNNPDIIIEAIAANKGHTLGMVNNTHDPLPLHTYTGGVDASFIVQGKCIGLEAKKKVENLKQKFDQRALHKTSRKFLADFQDSKKSEELKTAFLKVENELFALFGVDFVVPITLDFETVDGQPNVWEFNMTLLEYDPRVLASEELQFLDTQANNMGKILEFANFGLAGGTQASSHPVLDHALEFFSLQSRLAQQPVYSDMFLPTIDEFKLWVSACGKLGRLWTSAYEKSYDTQENFDKAIAKGYTSSEGYTISALDNKVSQYISDFLPEYHEEMAKHFTVDVTKIKVPGNQDGWVDPDFFCYYSPESSWAQTFKTISEDLMGKRVGLRAEGQKEQGKVKAPFRQIDHENLGLTTVFTENFYAVDDSSEKNNMAEGITNAWDKGTYPVERKEAAAKIYKDHQNKMDATPGQWWASTSTENPDHPNVLPLSEKDQAGVLLGPLKPGYNNPEPTIEDAKNLSKEMDSTGHTYFDLAWRQKLTKWTVNYGMTHKGSTTKNTVGDFLTPNLSTFIPVLGTIDGIRKIVNASTLQNTILPVGGSTIFLIPESPTVRDVLAGGRTDLYQRRTPPTIEDVEKYARTVSSSTLGYSYSERDYISSILGDNITAKDSFIAATARLNANYSLHAGLGEKEIDKTFHTTGTFEERMKGVSGVIDYYSKKYKLDPNLVRSVMAIKSGFGLNTTVGDGLGIELRAIGNSNYNTLSSDGKNLAALKTFMSILSRNMGEYNNVPSIALIATEMEIRRDARDRYYSETEKSIKSEHKKYLQDRSIIVSDNKFSETNDIAIKAINEATNKYPDAADLIGEYYTEYIELSRAIGVVYGEKTGYDPYFYPLSSIILMDDADNKDKVVPLVLPDGTKGMISLDRTRVDDVPYVVRTGFSGDVDKIDPERLAAMTKRLQSALDPSSEGAVYGSLVDMRKHSSFGRLLGAFPAFQVILINEGFYWLTGGRKLWDQYYTRTGIAEIEVFKTKYSPADTCSVTYSNAFNNLSAYSIGEARAQETSVAINKKIGERFEGAKFLAYPGVVLEELANQLLTKKIPDEVARLWKNNHLKALALTAGARIQVRLGWGSSAAALPIIFNGTVVDVPIQEGYLTIQAVSDGHELLKPNTKRLVKGTNSNTYSDTGFLGIGKDPSSIIAESMVGSTFWENISGGIFRDWSQGVTHFGAIQYEDATNRYPEILINLYGSHPTKLEQGIPSVRNYFNILALYNWDNKNLFSVEVDESCPWKVAEVCRHACLDYVAAAEPFCMQSTLFFGKPGWPYNYTYHPSILKFIQAPVKVPDSTKQAATKPDAVTNNKSPIIEQKATGLNNNLNGLPANLLTILTNMYKVAPVVRAIKAPAGWTVFYDDYATVTISSDGSLEVPFQYPTKAQSDAYQKLKLQRLEFPTAANLADLHGLNTAAAAMLGPSVGETQPGSYTYRPSDVNQFDALMDVNQLVAYLEWKNHMQAYIAHSCINLLQNNITISADKVCTDAYGIHKYNGVTNGGALNKTLTYSLDCNIDPSSRKTMEVQSIAGYVPIAIKRKDGLIDILPIEELAPETPDINNPKLIMDCDYQVLDKDGWTDVKGFMYHKTDKKIYSTILSCGAVDTTEEHSLVLDDLSLCKPEDALGKSGIVVDIPEFEPTKSMSHNLAWFYGAFVAEGSAGEYPKKLNPLINNSVFKIVNQDITYLERCLPGLEELGYEATIKWEQSSNVYALGLNTGSRKKGLTKNKLVKHMLKTCYTKRKEKRVPIDILNSDIETIRSFMDAYLEGDGYTKKEGPNNTKSIKRSKYFAYGCRDYTLSNQLYYLSKKLTGMDYGCCIMTKPTKTMGMKNYYQLRERLGYDNLRTCKPPNFIKKIDLSCRQEELVYDLSTASENYCAGIGNVLVHNTGILLTAVQKGTDVLTHGLTQSFSTYTF